MEKNHLLFNFFSVLFFTVAGTGKTNTLQFQTFVLNSLPNPSSLLWTEAETSLTVPEASEPDAESSLCLQLHHIDSLSFNKTPEHLFNLRIERDILRVKALTACAESAVSASAPPRNRSRVHGTRGFSSSVVSGLAQGSGEYFTRIGVGTPPRYAYMILDTGSDVVWLQCAPCKKCYSQTDPVFDPTKSRSFATVRCGTPLCRKLDASVCNRKRNTCVYKVSYGDGSFSAGDFSTETMTFRGSRVERVALGCGHDNEGLFAGSAGLLGLGRGRLSFPSQTGRRFNRKFSYCLVDRSTSAKPSFMLFGDAAISRTARFTPLLVNPKLDTFYYLELIGISVGGARVRGITASLFKLDPAGNGGVIIDSGTSVTRLTRPAYIALRDAFRAGASSLKRGADFSLFDTCFDFSGMTEVKVPTVVLHFREAELSLPATNYLIPVDNNGTFCFAFAGTMSGLSIIGNIQQQGFRVVYDLATSRVGFAPNGCA